MSARFHSYVFPSRVHNQPHLTARQYACIAHGWIESAGMDSRAYGTHSMRRTKAAQIYRETGNLRAVQLLLGHAKIESTVRYLGIEVDDALTLSEQSRAVNNKVALRGVLDTCPARRRSGNADCRREADIPSEPNSDQAKSNSNVSI